jgi:hypothetical protein
MRNAIDDANELSNIFSIEMRSITLCPIKTFHCMGINTMEFEVFNGLFSDIKNL